MGLSDTLEKISLDISAIRRDTITLLSIGRDSDALGLLLIRVEKQDKRIDSIVQVLEALVADSDARSAV